MTMATVGVHDSLHNQPYQQQSNTPTPQQYNTTAMRSPPHHQFPIPYRIDFTEENKGRHLDATKRKITWKFGFVHPPSVFPHLYDGDGDAKTYTGYRSENVERWNSDKKSVGVECRGREHEIVLVWSLVSGKAHVSVLVLIYMCSSCFQE